MIPECPKTREFVVHLLLDIQISFSCVTSIPDTFTAWLCQGGHFLCVVLHWRELSLCLRQPGGAKQHLFFLLTSVFLNPEIIYCCSRVIQCSHQL